MEYVIETCGLSKRYRSRWVLKDVNMHVQKGDVYGFVGENGSGKTTVIRLITGLISATEGGVSLFGVSDKTAEVLKALLIHAACTPKDNEKKRLCRLALRLVKTK